jgi:cobyrinic acid a,c-diamide synthase
VVSQPRLVIAATRSGEGKTTVATGLMAALRATGLRVSAHKVGPDYIDPSYHAAATGAPGRNLDAWLTGEDSIAPLLRHGAAGADVSVIEGVMGLFDGVSGRGDLASTAHVARLAAAPVVLVVSAAGAGRSIAATVHGFATFDPRVPVAGIVLNQVGTPRHEAIAREAIASTGIPVLGALPAEATLHTPSRHLGLVPAAERADHVSDWLPRLRELIARHLDLPGLLAIARSAPPLTAPAWSPESPGSRQPGPAQAGPAQAGPAQAGPAQAGSAQAGSAQAGSRQPGSRQPGSAQAGSRQPGSRQPGSRQPGSAQAGSAQAGSAQAGSAQAGSAQAGSAPSGTGRDHPAAAAARPGRPARIAVAAGRAFTFGYAEHRELLEAAGAEVTPFDPMTVERLPAGCDALVVGGGFPEVYVDQLAANAGLRAEIAGRVAAGMPVVAECAGLLWLGSALDGRAQCGVLPATARMTGRLTLGYREAVALASGPLVAAGTVVHAHEFHRTVSEPAAGDCPAWQLSDGSRQGWASPHVLASYLHLHWAGLPDGATRLVAAAATARSARKARS